MYGRWILTAIYSLALVLFIGGPWLDLVSHIIDNFVTADNSDEKAAHIEGAWTFIGAVFVIFAAVIGFMASRQTTEMQHRSALLIDEKRTLLEFNGWAVIQQLKLRKIERHVRRSLLSFRKHEEFTHFTNRQIKVLKDLIVELPEYNEFDSRMLGCLNEDSRQALKILLNVYDDLERAYYNHCLIADIYYSSSNVGTDPVLKWDPTWTYSHGINVEPNRLKFNYENAHIMRKRMKDFVEAISAFFSKLKETVEANTQRLDFINGGVLDIPVNTQASLMIHSEQTANPQPIIINQAPL